MKSAMFLFFFLAAIVYSPAQGCCSGGSGSPIAGNAATGILQKKQIELSVNYQYSNSSKFLAGDRDTTALFDGISSNYSFFRVDYGLGEKVTISMAAGYYFDRTLVESSRVNPSNNELEKGRVISSKGFGDLIVLPRFEVLNRAKGKSKTELDLGLGVKMAIGSHDDSTLVLSHPLIGDIYSISPPTVQTTNGSNDLMFLGLFLRSYNDGKNRVFVNALYLKKGFNSLGEKFGDYSSLSLSYAQNLTKKIGCNVQVKGEHVARMQAAKHIDLVAFYNVYKESTGSRSVFLIPQLNYTVKQFVFSINSEIPVYQYVNGSQISAQYVCSLSMDYRFMLGKK
jgi:hypothetical protein